MITAGWFKLLKLCGTVPRKIEYRNMTFSVYAVFNICNRHFKSLILIKTLERNGLVQFFILELKFNFIKSF